VEGDVMDLPLFELENAHALVAGPPCPPWSSAEMRLGEDDPRSEVFLRVVRWVVELGQRGTLLFFVLENVPGILTTMRSSHLRFVDKILQIIYSGLPHFSCKVVQLNMSSVLPVERKRVFIYGLRKDCFENIIPDPLPLLSLSPIRALDLLDMTLPNIVPGHFNTLSEKDNLAMYERRIEELLGKLGTTPDIACVDLQRRFDRVWAPNINFDRFPCITTKNRSLFLLSMWDRDEKPGDRMLHRYLSLAERFILQGMRPEYAGFLQKHAAYNVAGNACPPPLVAVVALPLLESIRRARVDIRRRVTPADYAELSRKRPRSEGV